MKLAIFRSLTETSSDNVQARWRKSGEMSWRPLLAPSSSQPTLYEIASALKRQLAEGDIALTQESADNACGVIFRLKCAEAFDLDLPSATRFAALGFPPSMFAVTDVCNQREPLGACFGLRVAKWDVTKPLIKCKRLVSIRGGLLAGRETGSLTQVGLRLQSVSTAQLHRLHDLVNESLMNDTPLLVLGADLRGGEWNCNENERVYLWPSVEAPFRVTRRALVMEKECFDLTLLMEVAA